MRPRSPATLAAILTGIAFILLSIAVEAHWLAGWDTQTILAVRTLDSPFVFHAMRTVSAIAHGNLAIPIALAVTGILAWRGDRWEAGFYAMTCLTGWGANIGLKEIFRRHRPTGISPKLTDAGWLSYPSGHAMLAVMVFGLGTYLLTMRWSRGQRLIAMALATLFIGLVMLCRVFLGAHWPTDTVGAVLAGTAWVTGAWAFAHRNRHPDHLRTSP